MTSLRNLVASVAAFRDEREWGQFHDEKELALSIVLEAGELLELFQWKTASDARSASGSQIEEEVADVLIYCMMLADHMGFDLEAAIWNKLRINAEHYPVERARGSKTKYTKSLPAVED